MSDDLDRDERIRPRHDDRPPPVRGPERDRPRRRDYDDEPPASNGGGLKVLFIVLSGVALLAFCLIGGVVVGGVWLFRTAAKSVGAAAAQMQAQSNYIQIGTAIHTYNAAHGKLPPVAMKTRDGKLGLSWRVAILPYMEHSALHKRFKLDEAWDSPANLLLAQEMPLQYAPSNNMGGRMTHARAFVGNRAMFDLNRQYTLGSIKDGLTNTIMVVEAAESVIWTKPDELPFDPKKPLPPLGLPGNPTFTALMGDGTVRPISKTINAEKLKLAIDAADGQPVDLDN